MTPPERPVFVMRRVHRTLLSGVLAAFFLYTVGIVPALQAQSQSRGQGLAQGPAVLPADRAAEHELARGDLQRYALTMAAGEYVRVIVEQHGIDVVIQTLDPNGAPITEFQGEPTRQGQEIVELVA